MTLAQVKDILERHAGMYQRAYVFGSVARGEQDQASDVDLLLVRSTRAAFFDRIREVMGLVRDLGAVDLLIYTPAELDELVGSRRNGFLQQVLAEGVKVEGRQGGRAALASAGRK